MCVCVCICVYVYIYTYIYIYIYICFLLQANGFLVDASQFRGMVNPILLLPNRASRRSNSA